MKFYIGSGIKNCEAVNYYSKILEENGLHHTYHWVKNINGDKTMELALNKRIFLCSETKEAFSIESTVNFYQLPNIVRLVGTPDENLKEIIKLLKGMI